MPAPRDIADLPYASWLKPFHGELEPDGTLDCLRFDGIEFEDVRAGNSRFLESAFTGVTFTRGHLRRARFNDVWMQAVRWVGTDLAESRWVDAEIVSGSLAGVELFTGELRRVTFFNCKLDSVNLRTTALHDVMFVDCLLREVDFGGASLVGVGFPGSTLEGVRFAKARMKDVDLRGARSLGIVDGIEALRGATVGTAQLLDLAPMFAQAAGVTVTDA